MSFKSKLLITSLLLFSVLGYGQKNWIEIKNINLASKYYVDESTLQKFDFKIRCWLKYTMRTFIDIDSKIYFDAYSINFVEYDCKDSKIKVYPGTIYSEKGEIIRFFIFSEEWKSLERDDTQERLFKGICELYEK